MPRPLTLLAAALIATPLPALAQGARLAPLASGAMAAAQPVAESRPAARPAPAQARLAVARAVFQREADAQDAEVEALSRDIEVREKAEWSDDQGLRVSRARIAFKRRF